jgi:uncharacterized membrane protein
MESHRKSILKAISWRVLGSLGTFVIGWAITGSAVIGASISAVEFFLKIVLFYGHERLWSRVK